jgi:Mn-dependent DtxR family transcriptional regulator
MGALAGALRVVPERRTTMVKALADGGLVEHQPRYGVRLTGEGRRVALNVLRKHRLVETFLVNVLKMDWSKVHEEAEQLEHAISDEVLGSDSMRLLGHPKPIRTATRFPAGRASELPGLRDARDVPRPTVSADRPRDRAVRGVPAVRGTEWASARNFVARD